MNDFEAKLEELLTEAEDCDLIAELATDRKRCFQATALRSCFRYAHGSS